MIDKLIAASSIGAGLRNIRENGMEAELEDIADETASKPRRKARVSPAARTNLVGKVFGRITLEVLGVPAPKGSGRAMLIGGIARHVPSGSSANQRALRAWDNAVKAACQAQIDRSVFTAFPEETPLRVSIAFRFTRPNAHYGTGRNADRLKAGAPLRPTGKPDVDKLARSTLDSLTGLAFYDDSRIVELTVSKVYADAIDPLVRPSFDAPGAVIEIEEWKPQQSTDMPSDLVPDALAVQLSRARRT